MHRIVTNEVATRPLGKSAGLPWIGRTLGAALILGSSHVLAQEPGVAKSKPQQPRKASTPRQKKNAKDLGAVSVYGEALEPVSPKFTAPLVDTPMSVTVLPQSVMQETAATSLQDALRNVPGITFAAGEGGTPTGDLPSIRGFNASGDVYVDGLQDIGVQSRDIFDLEQVEVIKGPDSSIGGRNAGGGIINLVSKTAQANNFAEATGTYGSAGQYRATLDGNARLSDSVAARLNVMKMGGGVPGRDSAVRSDKKGIAGTVTFGLQKPTRLILNYYHFEDNSTPDYGIPADYADTGRPLTETLGIDRKNYYGLADRDFRHNPVDSGSARFEHDFGDAWTLRSQLRYTNSQNKYILTLPQVSGTDEVYRLPISNNDRTRSLAGGIDLFGHFDTGSIHHDVDVGFEALREKEHRSGESFYDAYNVVSPSGPQGFGDVDCGTAQEASYDCTNLYDPNPHDPWQGTITPNPADPAVLLTTRDLAPYVFDTITFSPRWKANVGVRWDAYRTSSSAPDDPAVDNALADSRKESFASYQAALMYKPAEAGTIYLMTNTALIPETQASSNSGQDQIAKGQIPPDPEKTRSVELGTKWNLFGNRLLLSGDVFVEHHTNTPISVSPDVTEQVGKTTSKGVEVSANGSITENWNIIAGYSHIDAKITKGGLYDEVGQQLPNTPTNTFSLWSTYRVAPTFTVGGGAYYRGKQVGYAGPPDEYIDSYWRFDTMANWQVAPHIALQLNVQNLFDKHYYSKDFYWYALPAPGRTYMASIDLKF